MADQCACLITEDNLIIPTYVDKPMLDNYSKDINKDENGWIYDQLMVSH